MHRVCKTQFYRTSKQVNPIRHPKFPSAIGRSCRFLRILPFFIKNPLCSFVGAFPVTSIRPGIVMQTRKQSNDASVITPRNGAMKSMAIREGIRVVSPDVAVRSVVLFESTDDNEHIATSIATSSNDSFTTPVKIPAGRKRKAETKVETESIFVEDIQKAKTSNAPSTPRPKRTKTPTADDANTSTPKTSKYNATATVTPNKENLIEPKQSKSSSNIIKAPINWLDTYTLVKELRHDRTAPCDHSGCEALPDKHTDPITRRFQVLMCLMLSSQTKDAVVGAAIRTMQGDKVLNIHSVHQMDSATLDGYIQKVGFHNNKTKYIKEAVQILMDKYSGDIPRTASEMIQDLPGIGPKMAYIIESVAWGTQSGIGVDTHMHRLFNLLHWVNKTNTPEKTRLQLESWLPQEYWAEVNILWVGFGQEVQQEKAKILRKALVCSRPKDALQLLKRCGLDYRKVGNELGIMDDIDAVLK